MAVFSLSRKTPVWPVSGALGQGGGQEVGTVKDSRESRKGGTISHLPHQGQLSPGMGERSSAGVSSGSTAGLVYLGYTLLPCEDRCVLGTSRFGITTSPAQETEDTRVQTWASTHEVCAPLSHNLSPTVHFWLCLFSLSLGGVLGVGVGFQSRLGARKQPLRKGPGLHWKKPRRPCRLLARSQNSRNA